VHPRSGAPARRRSSCTARARPGLVSLRGVAVPAAWNGLPLRDARAGLQAIASELAERDDDLVDLAARDPAPDAIPARLLAAFDPYLLGWKDREFAVPAEHSKRVHPGGGLLRATATVDGLAVGTWSAAGAHVQLEPFGRLPAGARVALVLLAMILHPEAFQPQEPSARRLATARGHTAQGVARTMRFDRAGHPIAFSTRLRALHEPRAGGQLGMELGLVAGRRQPRAVPPRRSRAARHPGRRPLIRRRRVPSGRVHHGRRRRAGGQGGRRLVANVGDLLLSRRHDDVRLRPRAVAVGATSARPS
jgi:hypothetical protein